MTNVTVKAAEGGSFSAYLATPKTGKGPGILVIQEIFGVNAAMREIADDYASQGYVALCPDLFWRQQPGIELTDKTDAEWKRAFELFNGFDQEKGVEDLKAAMKHLRGLPSCSGKVGWSVIASAAGWLISWRRVAMSIARSVITALPSKACSTKPRISSVR